MKVTVASTNLEYLRIHKEARVTRIELTYGRKGQSGNQNLRLDGRLYNSKASGFPLRDM